MNDSEKLRCTGTFAITVTYGDRYRFVQQVVASALANGVRKVIVVDNGTAEASKKSIRNLATDFNGQVAVVTLLENRGSAGGFKAGLDHARNCSDCDYLWLLDDDNRPADGALQELFIQYEKLSQFLTIDRLALMSSRIAWEEHKQIARGVPVCKVFPRKSSFMGFHFLTPPKAHARFLQPIRPITCEPKLDYIEIPFGPYGGLFFHKAVIATLGYPNESLFLYNDDTEYTSRLMKIGGKLFLIPSSVINDLELPHSVFNQSANLFYRLLTASDRRTYYAIRNQSYLETHDCVSNKITYAVNGFLFFLLLTAFALRYGKWKRLALIIRAVRAGKAAKLGSLQEFEETEPLVDQKNFL